MSGFQIQKSEFVKLLNRTVSIAGEKSTMEILAHVCLNFASGQGLTVKANDLSIGVSVTTQEVVLKKNTKGGITLPAKDLGKIVKSLPDGIVSFEYDDRYLATIKAGKSKFTLAGQDEVNFPRDPEIALDKLSECNSEELLSALNKTVFASSTDETRAHMAGVYLEPTRVGFVAVATDGTRLAKYESKQAIVSKPAIIPRRTCQELVKLLQDKSEGVTKIGFDSSRIIVSRGAVLFVGKQIDAVFPDYQQILPNTKAPTQVTLLRSELKDAIGRLVQIGADGVKFSVTQGAAILSADNGDKTASDEVGADVKGKGLDIGFSTALMLELLSASSATEVTLGLTDETSPIVISPVAEDNYIGILMPMRIAKL